MSYSKTAWTYLIPVNPTNLNKIEQGIYDAGFPAYIDNAVSPNNCRIAMDNNGCVISRNVADAQVPLKINNVNASTSGAICLFQWQGVTKMAVSIYGEINAYLIAPGDGDDATFFPNPNGAQIWRNKADAYAALTINQKHASSTGNILDLQFGGTSKSSVSIAGAPIFAGDTITLTTSKTPASAAAAGTVGMICWDASYIYVCTTADTWKRAGIATW